MHKKVVWMCLCFCLLLTQLGSAAAGERAENSVKSFSASVVAAAEDQAEILRIEIGFQKPTAAFKVHGNDLNPKELIIDLNKTRLSKVKKDNPLGGKMAENIQFLKLDKANSRAVVTLANELGQTNYKVYTLPSDAKAKKPFRIVIDIFDRQQFEFTAGLAGKRILIDPGHGGSDSGAIGPNRVMEKDVTLDVSARVEAILRQAGAAVATTREDDRDVYGRNATDRQELQARVEVGRRSDADVFLSIHANSFTSSSAHGTATYYYPKTSYDQMLAQDLQDGMVEFGGRYDRKIAEANFYVVKRSAMPAALVELAFISNDEEERLLDSPEFRQKLAEGICKGLSKFFSRVGR